MYQHKKKIINLFSSAESSWLLYSLLWGGPSFCTSTSLQLFELDTVNSKDNDPKQVNGRRASLKSYRMNCETCTKWLFSDLLKTFCTFTRIFLPITEIYYNWSITAKKRRRREGLHPAHQGNQSPSERHHSRSFRRSVVRSQGHRRDGRLFGDSPRGVAGGVPSTRSSRNCQRKHSREGNEQQRQHVVRSTESGEGCPRGEAGETSGRGRSGSDEHPGALHALGDIE